LNRKIRVPKLIVTSRVFCLLKTASKCTQTSFWRQQELSYRQQIARKLRTEYAKGISRHKYYTVILKSRWKVTQGHWKRNDWIDHTRLSYLTLNTIVTLKCGLEVTQGHWKWYQWKLEYCFLFAFHSNHGFIFSHFGDIQRQAMAWHWNLSLGSFKIIENCAVRQTMYDFLLVRHCNYSSVLYHLRVIWRWIISWPWNHDLYGSTSCCISQWPK